MFKRLKPSKAGLKVFNPATKLHLPESGVDVSINSYWMRRISCGDVVECSPAIKVSKKTTKKNSKKTNKMEV